MLKISFSNSKAYARYRTKQIRPMVPGEQPVFDRQCRVPGFKQENLSRSKILLIGAGGIGSEIGEGLVRKGIGHLIIADGDIVQLSNLNRQRFYRNDLYKNKALTLAKNLSKDAVGSTAIEAYACDFEPLSAEKTQLGVDAVVCGVDSDETRVFTSKYFLEKVTVVFLAVDENADHGYVFIQDRKGKPCFCCLYPEAIANKSKKRCTPAGATKDILKVVAGMTLYALDTILMERKRDWNYRHVSLAGFTPDVGRWIEPRQNCPVCEQTGDSRS